MPPMDTLLSGPGLGRSQLGLRALSRVSVENLYEGNNPPSNKKELGFSGIQKYLMLIGALRVVIGVLRVVIGPAGLSELVLMFLMLLALWMLLTNLVANSIERIEQLILLIGRSIITPICNSH